MSRLLLDTTFLVDAELSPDALDLIDDDDDTAIAAITVAELQVGVLLADRRRRTARQRYVGEILGTIPVLDYDREVAAAHAELLVHVRRQGEPRGAHDLIIAATARSAGRMVLTADRSAFDALPGVEMRLYR